MQKKHSHPARTEFLREFIRTLIAHYRVQHEEDQKYLRGIYEAQQAAEKYEHEETAPIEIPAPQPVPVAPPVQPQSPAMREFVQKIVPQKRPLLKPRLPSGGMIHVAPHEPLQQSAFPKPTPPKQPEKPQPLAVPAPPQSFETGKLGVLYHDPTVMSIECQGPDKNILVNKGGRIETTPIRLTKEEISAILKDISEKTRIPITTGMFKTAYKNIILSGVISDMVGTRFVIQKRMPPAPPQ